VERCTKSSPHRNHGVAAGEQGGMMDELKQAGKSENDKLYDAALEAIEKLFTDVSVSKTTARQNMESLRDEIDVMIKALRAKDNK
jgi:hypothetical protein